MSFHFKKTDEDDDYLAQINIIPLVDVSLVVLIIFIVTVNHIVLPSIKLNLPQSSRAKTTSSEESINLSISSEGIIYLDNKVVTLKEMEEQVKKLHEEAPDKSVVVGVDKSTHFQRVIDALDTLNALGIVKLDIRTINK